MGYFFIVKLRQKNFHNNTNTEIGPWFWAHTTLDRLINLLNSILERHWLHCAKLSSAAMKFCIMHDCLVGLRSGQVIFIMEGQKLLTLSPTHVVI